MMIKMQFAYVTRKSLKSINYYVSYFGYVNFKSY